VRGSGRLGDAWPNNRWAHLVCWRRVPRAAVITANAERSSIKVFQHPIRTDTTAMGGTRPTRSLRGCGNQSRPEHRTHCGES